MKANSARIKRSSRKIITVTRDEHEAKAKSARLFHENPERKRLREYCEKILNKNLGQSPLPVFELVRQILEDVETQIIEQPHDAWDVLELISESFYSLAHEHTGVTAGSGGGSFPPFEDNPHVQPKAKGKGKINHDDLVLVTLRDGRRRFMTRAAAETQINSRRARLVQPEEVLRDPGIASGSGFPEDLEALDQWTSGDFARLPLNVLLDLCDVHLGFSPHERRSRETRLGTLNERYGVGPISLVNPAHPVYRLFTLTELRSLSDEHFGLVYQCIFGDMPDGDIDRRDNELELLRGQLSCAASAISRARIANSRARI